MSCIVLYVAMLLCRLLHLPLTIQGFTAFDFTVTLSTVSDQVVEVLASTSSISTTEGDFIAFTNQLVTFNPGETQKTVTVQVRQYGLEETNERFFLRLDNPGGGFLGEGVGRILNDDV